MKVVYSNSAKVDLKAINRWIAEENPSRARSFVAELRMTRESLGDFSKANQVIGQFSGKDVRRKVFGNYLIFYVILEVDVKILRVLHGAQDYSDLS